MRIKMLLRTMDRMNSVLAGDKKKETMNLRLPYLKTYCTVLLILCTWSMNGLLAEDVPKKDAGGKEKPKKKAAVSLIVPATSSSERIVVGWGEKIRLAGSEILLHAELDPTRQHSSIRVDNVEEFETSKKKSKKKKKHVRFTLEDRYGHSVTYEKEVQRSQRIRTASGKTRTDLVVELGVCLGNRYVEDEFILSKKKVNEYEARLGRETLEGNFIIDPALTYTVTPSCTELQSSKK